MGDNVAGSNIFFVNPPFYVFDFRPQMWEEVLGGVEWFQTPKRGLGWNHPLKLSKMRLIILDLNGGGSGIISFGVYYDYGKYDKNLCWGVWDHQGVGV